MLIWVPCVLYVVIVTQRDSSFKWFLVQNGLRLVKFVYLLVLDAGRKASYELELISPEIILNYVADIEMYYAVTSLLPFIHKQHSLSTFFKPDDFIGRYLLMINRIFF